MPDRQEPDPSPDPWDEPDEGVEKVNLPPNAPGIGIPVRGPQEPAITT
jgi:hypothetical protein